MKWMNSWRRCYHHHHHNLPSLLRNAVSLSGLSKLIHKSSLSASDCSLFIHRYGKLRKQEPSSETTSSRETLNHVVGLCKELTLSPRDSSHILYGIAVGKLLESDSSLRTSGLLDRLAERKDYKQSTPDDLFHILYSLAILQWNKNGILEKIVNEVKSRNSLASFSPMAISNMIWSCAKLRHADEDFLEKISTELLSRDLEKFNSQNLSNIVWSYATLRCRATNLLFSKISKEICSRSLTQFSPQAMSNILWSYVTLNNLNHPELARHFVSFVNNHGLQRFNSQEFSVFLWSVSHLLSKEDQNANDLYKLATKELSTSTILNELTPQGMSLVLNSYANIGILEDDTIFTLFSTKFAKTAFHKYSIQAICNIVWSYAKFGKKMDESLFLLVQEEILHRRSLGSFQIRDLVNLLWSSCVTMLNEEKEEGGGVLVEAILKELQIRDLKLFSPLQISQYLWSLTKKGNNTIASEKIFEFLHVCKLRDFGMQDLSQIAYCLGKFGRNDPVLFGYITREILSRKSSIDSQMIRNILWSLAHLQIYDTELIRHLLTQHANFHIRDLSTIIWSLACLDSLNLPEVQQFLEEERDDLSNFEKNLTVAQQLHQVFLAYNNNQSLPKLLLQLKGEDNWMEFLLKNKNDYQSSPTHLTISKLLQTEYPDLKIVNEYRTSSGQVVDVYLQELNTVVEVNGPFHYLHDGAANGSTIFKERLLKKEGYNVVIINLKKDWEVLSSSEERRKFLRTLL